MDNFSFGVQAAPELVVAPAEPVTPVTTPSPAVVPSVVDMTQGEDRIDLTGYYFGVSAAPSQYYLNNSPDGQSDAFYVDVEITVSNESSNTKLVKRIKFSKQELAKQAGCKDAMLNISATFIEQKEEPTKVNQRLLELAGIRHSKNFV